MSSDAVRSPFRCRTNCPPLRAARLARKPASCSSETEPTIAGKPHAPVTELVQAQMGPRPIMIGDRADTDGEFATALACDFALVFTGVTAPEDLPIEPEPAHVGTDLAALVDAIYLSVG